MKIILTESDKIDINGSLELLNLHLERQEAHKASYIVFHMDDKAIIIKNRLDGYIGECSIEKSFEYLKLNTKKL